MRKTRTKEDLQGRLPFYHAVLMNHMKESGCRIQKSTQLPTFIFLSDIVKYIIHF